MKALDYLYRMKQRNDEMGMTAINIDEAIEEIEKMEAKLKQGQDNFNKLWDMYSELKIENKELEEYINETKDCMYCKEARAIKIWDERGINEKV